MMRWMHTTILGLGLLSARGGWASPERPVEEGRPVPALQLFTVDRSTKFKLAEVAYPGPEKRWSKKRPVLIDFFRTDCGPCRQSLPELVAVAERYRAQGLEVVMVALLEAEGGQQKLETFLAAQRLPFPVLVDANEHVVRKFLGSSVALPATMLVDREGRLVRAKYDGRGSLSEFFGDAIEASLAPPAAAAK